MFTARVSLLLLCIALLNIYYVHTYDIVENCYTQKKGLLKGNPLSQKYDMDPFEKNVTLRIVPEVLGVTVSHLTVTTCLGRVSLQVAKPYLIVRRLPEPDGILSTISLNVTSHLVPVHKGVYVLPDDLPPLKLEAPKVTVKV